MFTGECTISETVTAQSGEHWENVTTELTDTCCQAPSPHPITPARTADPNPPHRTRSCATSVTCWSCPALNQSGGAMDRSLSWRRSAAAASTPRLTGPTPRRLDSVGVSKSGKLPSSASCALSSQARGRAPAAGLPSTTYSTRRTTARRLASRRRSRRRRRSRLPVRAHCRGHERGGVDAGAAPCAERHLAPPSEQVRPMRLPSARPSLHLNLKRRSNRRSRPLSLA